MPRFAGPQNARGFALLASVLTAAAALAVPLVAAIGAQAAPSKGASLVCPPGDRGQSAPTALRTGERRMLVPTGAISLTVCSYNGMNALGGAPPWGLLGVGVTNDRSEIKRLTAALDAIKPTHRAYPCPMDDGSDAIATFGYGSPPGVVVKIGTGGCNAITNGHVQRLGLETPVVSQIEALAKPRLGFKWAMLRGHLRLCGGPVAGRCYIENYDSGDRVVVSESGGPGSRPSRSTAAASASRSHRQGPTRSASMQAGT